MWHLPSPPRGRTEAFEMTTAAAARVSRGAAGRHRRQTPATTLLCCLLAVPALHATPQVRLRTAGRGPIPAPESLAARVETQGRTSRLVELEIAAVGQRVPRTFSRHLIGNTEGFDWYVSRHFALKTDLPETQVRESLTLLELGLPQLEAIFGASTAALADRRMAFVFASGRQALRRAMADDDLHVLNLGGITQEGYWGAYQYAGSPYQNRYIILHEFAHLFQYAVAGSTRHCYGFFIEGIADFFSSHVYDPESRQLTINVLDRAPMHNHLAAGLAEWERRRRPSLSALYAEGATTRGLDVLMTAFLQSTPEREIKWRLFCNETLRRGRPDQDPRQLSDDLMAALYGGWSALDSGFAAWMERLPTFEQLDYGFDQYGEALVSQDPLPGRTARLRLNPPPLARTAADAFTRDYPRPAARNLLPTATNAFSLGFTLCPPAQPPAGRLELRLGGAEPALRVSVSNGQQIVLATISSNWTCALPQQSPSGSGSTEIGVLLDVTPEAACVSLLRGTELQPLAQGSVPLDHGQFTTAGAAPAVLAATCGGYRLIPWFPEDVVPSPSGSTPSVRQAWRPLDSRFGTPGAAGPVFRALRALGTDAPDTLRIAGHMLLADAASAPGGQRRLPDDELRSEAFWKGLAEAIRTSAAGDAARQAALAALADAALDLALVPSDNGGGDAAIVRLRRPAIGAWRGSLSLRLDGLHLQTRALRGRRRAEKEEEVRLALPRAVRAGVHTVAATAEVTWMGQPLTLQRRVVANPGIPRWHVVGPFMLPGGVFTNTVFPPEQEAPDMGRLFAAPDGTQMHWRRVEPPPGQPLETDHLIHFAKGFRRQANFAAAYAAAFFDCEAAMPATLALGVSDGVQVWLNGECVLTDMRPREWAPGNVRVPVELARGANTLLVKSVHADGLWFLSARIEDGAGNPLRGISY